MTGLFLTACSQETDLTLRGDERWELVSVTSINTELIPDVGAVVEGLEVNIDTGEVSTTVLEATMDQLVAYYESEGIEVSWQERPGNKRNETAYELRLRGQGWEALSRLTTPPESALGALEQAGLENWPYGISVTETDEGQLRFEMNLPQGTSDLGLLFPTTFRLHGGKIVSANTPRIQGGVATWGNPQGTLEAVLTPASFLSAGNSAWPWIVLAVVVVAGAAALAVILMGQRSGRRTGPAGRYQRPIRARR